MWQDGQEIWRHQSKSVPQLHGFIPISYRTAALSSHLYQWDNPSISTLTMEETTMFPATLSGSKLAAVTGIPTMAKAVAVVSAGLGLALLIGLSVLAVGGICLCRKVISADIQESNT